MTRFCLFVEKSWWNSQHCLLRVHRNKVKRINFFKETFFLNYRTLRWKVSASSRNFLDKFFKTEFFVYVKRFLSKRFFFKNKIFLIFFGFCVTTFRLFVEKVVGVVKSTFYISIGTLWGKLFPLEKMSYFITVGQWAKFFRHLSKKVQENCQNCFPRVQKNTLLKQQVWRKKILSLADIEQKIVGFCKRIFSRLVERAFLCFHRNIVRRIFFEKVCFLFSFGYSGKKTSAFVENFPTSLLKLCFFLCPWEQFEANDFFFR